MKTKNLLKVLSLAVLLGGLAKVSSFSDFRSSGSELFLESTQGTDMFDDCQEGLRLQGPHRAQETGDLLASDVKFKSLMSMKTEIDQLDMLPQFHH